MSAKKIFNYTFCSLLLLNLFFVSAILSFKITLKGEMVTVPDLTNKTLDEAKEILGEKKLTVIKSGIELHDLLDKDKIIQQENLVLHTR